MKTPWFSLSLCSCALFGLTLAAAYPEMIWMDTDIAQGSYNYGLNFQIEPELFRASAVKSGCALGGQLGCALQ